MNEKDKKEGLQWWKEIITGLLAVGVFAGYGYFGLKLSEQPPDTPPDGTQASKAKTENTRKVVDGFFAILSAFVGYYAGRIPAERSANASQQLANQKTKEAEIARQNARDGARLLNRTLPTLRNPPAPPSAPTAAPSPNQILITEVEEFILRQPDA